MADNLADYYEVVKIECECQNPRIISACFIRSSSCTEVISREDMLTMLKLGEDERPVVVVQLPGKPRMTVNTVKGKDYLHIEHKNSHLTDRLPYDTARTYNDGDNGPFKLNRDDFPEFQWHNANDD